MVKSIKFSLLIIAVIALSTGGMSVSAAELSLVTYGDSITAGLIKVTDDGASANCPAGVGLGESFSGSGGLRCMGNGAEGVGGYQPELKQQLQEIGYEISIYNHGYSGITTDQMKSYISIFLSPQGYGDYVLLMGGVNDAFDNISASTVKFNLQSMVNTICDNGSVPVLTPATKVYPSASTARSVINSYKPEIQEITTNSNGNCAVISADQFSALSNSTGDYGGDGVHLSSKGNTDMAAEWLESLALPALIQDGYLPGIFLLLLDE